MMVLMCLPSFPATISKYSFNMIITDSASWEVVGRKARLAGNGPVLAKRCNATDERFPARPKGVTQMAIPCKLRLDLEHLGGSESAIIMLKEY